MLDFIAYNRMNTFVSRLVSVSETVTDTSYVDNSPNGLFTSPKGTILQKAGNVISYKYPGENTFTTLNYASNSINNLLTKYNVILGRGVNKNVTWIKSDTDGGTSWKNKGSLMKCIPPPTPTPTPTPPTCTSYFCADAIETVTLVISGTGSCEPSPSATGTYGQIMICENYIYVYDGAWKRVALETYS